MKTGNLWRKRLGMLLAVAGLGLAAGCDDGDDDKKKPTDVGDNDINTVLCIGDSITDGECAPAGAPYPSRLAGLSGKRTINEGVCGSTTATGVGRIGTLLERNNPGFVCILYGINDLTFGRGRTEMLTNLRSMVQAAKGNKSVPILATLLPTYDSHGFIAGEVVKANDSIRQLARDEGARLCDLEQEFGNNRALIQVDGLHPSDAGNQVIAAAFNDKIY